MNLLVWIARQYRASAHAQGDRPLQGGTKFFRRQWSGGGGGHLTRDRPCSIDSDHSMVLHKINMAYSGHAPYEMPMISFAAYART